MRSTATFPSQPSNVFEITALLEEQQDRPVVMTGSIHPDPDLVYGIPEALCKSAINLQLTRPVRLAEFAEDKTSERFILATIACNRERFRAVKIADVWLEMALETFESSLQNLDASIAKYEAAEPDLLEERQIISNFIAACHDLAYLVLNTPIEVPKLKGVVLLDDKLLLKLGKKQAREEIRRIQELDANGIRLLNTFQKLNTKKTHHA